MDAAEAIHAKLVTRLRDGNLPRRTIVLSDHVGRTLARDLHAPNIIFKSSAQIPVRADQSKPGQLHHVIEEAVFEPINKTRRREQRVSFGCFTHV